MRFYGVRGGFEALFLTLVRITVGAIMVAHGWQKFQDIPAWAGNLAGMGVPYPQISAYLSIAGELGGGLGLILGFLTPLAALGVAGTMAVAIWKVHWNNGLLAKDGGFEYPLTILTIALYFMARGSGPVGIDALFRRRAETKNIGEGI